MRTTRFLSLFAVAPALLLAVTNVLSANHRRQNHGVDLPGAARFDAQEQNETYSVAYPDPSLIRHPSTEIPGDDCSLTVEVDHVSRHVGRAYRTLTCLCLSRDAWEANIDMTRSFSPLTSTRTKLTRPSQASWPRAISTMRECLTAPFEAHTHAFIRLGRLQ